jgi:hypothetical protein
LISIETYERILMRASMSAPGRRSKGRSASTFRCAASSSAATAASLSPRAGRQAAPARGIPTISATTATVPAPVNRYRATRSRASSRRSSRGCSRATAW